MKHLTLSLTILFFCTTFSFAQTYLYKKGQSGLSLYAGTFLKNPDGIILGADYTINGVFSLGFAKSGSTTNSNYSFDVNVALGKIESEGRTITFPLVAAYSIIGGTGVFAAGGGLAMRQQLNETTVLTPVFLMLLQNNSGTYSRNRKTIGLGFELNMMFHKFRVAPSVLIAEGKSVMALVGGFTF